MNELSINNRESLIKRITASLTGYVGYVRTLSKLNLLDGAVIAEDVFGELLNSVYGWKLGNANRKEKNAAGIDLIDDEAKLIVQVSISDTRDKINHTIKELKEKQELYKGYRLLFLFIADDTKELRKGKDFQGLPDCISFNQKTDIYDADILINEINGMSTEDMMKMDALISKLLDMFPFFGNNKEYKKRKEEVAELEKEVAKARSWVEKYPDEEDFRTKLQDCLAKYTQLKESLSQDEQHIFEVAQKVANLQGQKITERTQRAIAAFEAGDITTAKVILAEADHDQTDYAEEYVQSKAVTEEKLKTAISKLEEKNLRVSVIMADLSVPINDRIREALDLWRAIDADALKIDYAKHEADKNDELLYAYFDFLDDYGYYQESLSVQKRLLKLRKARFGEEHEGTAESYNNLGYLLNNLGQHAQALPYLEKAAAIQEKVLGTEHSDTATSYNNIGMVYYSIGDYPKALEFLEKALAIREKVLGSEHPDTATSYNNIGLVYDDMGEYSKTLEYYEKALAIKEKVLGTEHPSTATSYNNIGLVYDDMGEYTKALEYHEKALAIREKVLGSEHPDTATSYNNIGGVYKSMGEYTKALEYYEKALAIKEKVLSTEHPDTATSYNNIGAVYDDMGEYTKALEYYEKDLAISEKVLGTEHPDTATSYNNIGLVYQRMGEYTKALEYHEKALAIKEKMLGTEHPHTATSYNNIGVVYDSMGDYPKALEYLEKALAIFEKVLGSEHPYTRRAKRSIEIVKSKISG